MPQEHFMVPLLLSLLLVDVVVLLMLGVVVMNQLVVVVVVLVLVLLLMRNHLNPMVIQMSIILSLPLPLHDQLAITLGNHYSGTP